jgi:CRISPR-associated protein Cas1
MAWRNIIITQQCKISAKLEILIVQTADDLHEIPLVDVDSIMIQTTRAVITTHALSECLKRDIKVICCDEKSMPVGEITPYYSNDSRVSYINTQIKWGKAKQELLWQQIVREKISHQALVLDVLHRKDATALRELAQSVQPGDPDNREAVAAHMYFPRLFSYEFRRSDGLNPLNALLDYGYSLLLSETARQVCANGYLTEIGIHHDSDQNPFNLACDLMEPFRPYIDLTVSGLKEPELTPHTKNYLISTMLKQLPDRNTTLTQSISVFVRDCLRFLSDKRKEIPHLGFFEQEKSSISSNYSDGSEIQDGDENK